MFERVVKLVDLGEIAEFARAAHKINRKTNGNANKTIAAVSRRSGDDGKPNTSSESDCPSQWEDEEVVRGRVVTRKVS